MGRNREKIEKYKRELKKWSKEAESEKESNIEKTRGSYEGSL